MPVSPIVRCIIKCDPFWIGVCKLLVDMHINYLSLDVPVVCGQIFFTERVINPWNSLPPTVSFSSLSSVQQTICNVDFSSFVSYHSLFVVHGRISVSF